MLRSLSAVNMAGWHCCGFVVCLLLTSTSGVQGVDVGTLPTLGHGVSGTLEILSTTSLRIRDFSYDGNGPAAFLYYYAPGVPVDPRAATSQGITIPLPSPAGDSTGAFVVSRAYDNEDITFDLPAGTDVCDISTLTIWCEDFDVFFTELLIPTSTFAENGADPCRLADAATTQPPATVPPPSASVGTLPTLDHGVSGTLEILSTTTLRITDFSYDGLGPAAFLYYYPPGVPVDPVAATSQGIKIPLPSPAGDSTGAFVENRAYDNEVLTFDLPAGTDVCNISTFTIWCEDFDVFFTELLIPTSTFVEGGADPCRIAAQEAPPAIVGTLPNLRHGVSGTLEILSTTTMQIRDFSYDGLGPGAFLYYYAPGVPVDPVAATSQGIKIPLPSPEGDSTGAFVVSRAYDNEVLTFDLPAGTDVCDISTITIWCEDFDVFFTQLLVPTSTFVEGGADPCRVAAQEAPPPPPANVGTLPTLDHGVSGMLEVLSTTNLRITDFSYDGLGPAAFLYYYPPGVPVDPVRATSQGIKILLPSPEGDSSGALVEGRAYNREVLTFDLPAGTDLCDISTFTIWCEDFDVFFTELLIPRSTFVDDGADPCRITAHIPTPTTPDNENCIPLDNSLQLSWTVDEGNARVDFTICGCQSSNPSITQYMGFGLSGSNSGTLMDGADVTISWMDNSDGPSAEDYHLRNGNRVQCRNGLGVCPDTLDDRGTCSNNVLSVSGFTTGRKQCVRFSRPFTTDDDDCDLPIDPSNTQQYIVWGVGPLEETAFRHFTRAEAGDPPIHLGREPLDECQNTPITCESCPPFAPMIPQPRDGLVYEARIGPSGSDRGYMALTGQAGWGIAWYINGVLAPELYVIRGETYTFTVEGGNDPRVPSSYHPFYITDSASGGRLQNTPEQQEMETVFAGFDEDGTVTGTGRLCTLAETADAARIRERCGPVDMYIDSLSTTCAGGASGTVRWTPDADTLDVVYYQCATHRNLGWRINVVNDASEIPGFISSSPPLLVLSLSTIALMSLTALLLSQ